MYIAIIEINNSYCWNKIVNYFDVNLVKFS